MNRGGVGEITGIALHPMRANRQSVRVSSAPSNRRELAEALDRAGVHEVAYNLQGDPGMGEKYVLELVPGGWATYYAERGLRQSERHFETEDEACRTFFDWVVGDTTTRRDRPQPSA